MHTFDGLRLGSYRAIYCDCPWKFLVRSPKGMGRSADRHYQTMTLSEIKALPVADLAMKDAVLLFWVTDPFLEVGMDIIKRWGFKYKTIAFDWVKLNPKSDGYHMGNGYWTRSNPERVLLATRGKPKRKAKDVRQLVISRRREHSRKPDEMYERIERLLDGPYVELFGRTERPGWHSWGNEIGRWKYAGAGALPAAAAQ
jgi:N6-adenosine-specific RNA methylase IME4